MPDRKFDPRTKLFIVLCLSSMGVIIKNIYMLFVILLISIVVSKLFACDFFSYYKKIKNLIKIIILIAVVQSIFSGSGSVLISIRGLRILTTGGILKAAEFILRMSVVIISASIITTSNYREIVQGLVQMKIPYEIAFMVSVGIRFLPLMVEEFKDAMTAIQLRGIELDKIPIKSKLKIYSYIFTPVIAGSIIKAKRLSITMETRAFRAYPNRVSYMILNMRFADYIVMIITFIITALIVGIYVCYMA
ncbi:energy-coupling factor transporter transmembrane component T family protein [Abyssisolibacter fermentans]|uniref:energy-coupling factor transporter transmembrane component T family protein n=1 Tax=Abyssisolibacter fermentans TaxID=1766203 RepID=UPI00082D53E5|nr:energy-coupling factor transporter transmembrane component T [Abyssisolibacter fermentans]